MIGYRPHGQRILVEPDEKPRDESGNIILEGPIAQPGAYEDRASSGILRAIGRGAKPVLDEGVEVGTRVLFSPHAGIVKSIGDRTFLQLSVSDLKYYVS